MDSDGDPHPHTPGDPHSVLHSHTHPPTNPHEEEKASRISMKRRLKKLRQEAAARKKLEQGPSELQKEDPGTPQVRQISPSGAPEIPAGSHGHPETPAPTNARGRDRQRRQAKRIAELNKLREAAAALKLEQKEDPGTPDVSQITPGSLSSPAALATGSPETSAFQIEEQAESIEPEPARLRHSFLYSDRPRRSKRSTRVEEHGGEVSSREFEALTLDQSPPTPDSAHRAKKHDSVVSNMELEARTLHQSPPTLDSTPSIEEYALEVRALKLAQTPPTLDSTHRSTNSETGSEIIEEKPKKVAVPWVYRPVRVDILEALIAHSNGYRNPVQHKLDAQALWASGKKFVSPEEAESLASRTENLAQGEASRKEIIENGKKWMGKEVMLAFETYIEGKEQFKDVLYCLDDIKHQCFSVESYNHIFHHFNFTVKTKKISDDDWSLTDYFCEVKELYGRKYYSCFKLHSYDDGHCYACKNQGMLALQHPILGLGYEGGHPAMGPPFVYLSDDDYFD